MITIELQHFHGCPNSKEMIKRVREAIAKSKVDVEFKEILVDTPEKAELQKFRGSQTVLVNGNDLLALNLWQFFTKTNLRCSANPFLKYILNNLHLFFSHSPANS